MFANKEVSEKFFQAWVQEYFLKNMGAFEKRLLNWWVEEGFFNIGNVKETERGVSVELMLTMGKNIFDLISASPIVGATSDAVVQKKSSGWQLEEVPGMPNTFLLLNTKLNKDLIKRLLAENIRSFHIVDIEISRLKEIEFLKSVTIEVYRKTN